MVFPCKERHVICLECFKQFCSVRLSERQFWQHPEFGYTLSCPIGCTDSFIEELHHFRLLSETQVGIQFLHILLFSLMNSVVFINSKNYFQ